jgi:polyribonucleotide nucleotidyltransferase
MDVKVDKVTREIMKVALEKARIARNHILDLMYDAIPEPNKEVSEFVPKIKTVQIPQKKIGDVIGRGGEVIKKIMENYTVEVFIDDNGLVKVTGFDIDKVDQAINHIKNLTTDVEKGNIFEGKVTRIEKYGLFVEVLPGKTGLLHASNMKSKPNGFKLGQIVKVKVLKVEGPGKFQLELLEDFKEEKDGGQ